ncbi:MAG: DUF3307 domain-containing protein [Pseudomonadota bacterium]
MEPGLASALILLALLQVKHLFADFFLQTHRMLMGRDEYVHLGRIQHVGIHGGLSFVVLAFAGVPVVLAGLLCVLEAAVHYHIDWIKGWYTAVKEHGPTDANYWRAFGTDQLAHQLTYIAMIWVLIASA